MGTSFYREWKLKFSDMRLSAGIILLVFAGGLGIQYFLHEFSSGCILWNNQETIFVFDNTGLLVI